MLNFKNISKTYHRGDNSYIVLENVSFSINNSEISLIRGNSGVGKSTLLNIIGCLLKPDSGNLQYDGRTIDLCHENTEEFRINTFSYVFQDYNLLPEFNIYENLIIPAYINRIDIEKTKSKINSLLDYMEISYLKYVYPDTISHGEKQRVAILRALLGNKKIILADEPTGNLDEINTKMILDLITNINKDLKYTFVIVSHDHNFNDIAHNVYKIKNKIISYE